MLGAIAIMITSKNNNYYVSNDYILMHPVGIRLLHLRYRRRNYAK